ncbi:MAG TPA: dihydrofolate reductase [Desulfobulbus sp.]|nr:dihydrofolate reductase [Desulfobulbus sp.]
MYHDAEIILIAAMAANRVIGRDNTIPWDIPGEQSRFKKITMGHPLIMGRKTWQSIGHPLPGRRNIVLSRKGSFQAPGAEVSDSLEEGIARCADERKIFIIGGEQLYRLALPLADTLILTILPEPVAGDARFPQFSAKTFSLVNSEQIRSPRPYTINTYQRIQR